MLRLPSYIYSFFKSSVICNIVEALRLYMPKIHKSNRSSRPLQPLNSLAEVQVLSYYLFIEDLWLENTFSVEQ